MTIHISKKKKRKSYVVDNSLQSGSQVGIVGMYWYIKARLLSKNLVTITAAVNRLSVRVVHVQYNSHLQNPLSHYHGVILLF